MLFAPTVFNPEYGLFETSSYAVDKKKRHPTLKNYKVDSIPSDKKNSLNWKKKSSMIRFNEKQIRLSRQIFYLQTLAKVESSALKCAKRRRREESVADLDLPASPGSDGSWVPSECLQRKGSRLAGSASGLLSTARRDTEFVAFSLSFSSLVS